MSEFKRFIKAIAVAASKLQGDGDFMDDGDSVESVVHDGLGKPSMSNKWKLYTFVNGVELRAVCDGEKRGVFADEPGIYYATPREVVTLVGERYDGTSTSKSHSKDQVKIEMLGTNVMEVAKMQLGRLMRDWKRDHPPQRIFKPYDEQELLRRKQERQARRVTMFGDDTRLPKATPPATKQREEQGSRQKQGGRVSLDKEQEASSEDEDEETGDKPLSRKAQKKAAKKKRAEAAAKEAEAQAAKEGKQKMGATKEAEAKASDRQVREETYGDEEEEEGDEMLEEGTYVYVEVPMTFEALSDEFIACFRNLEELSVKYYDDRVRGFPAFAFQHNPLTRVLSLRNSITDLEQAQEQVFGSRVAAANYVLNHFPGSEILNLYLRGFPDRFRDQLNQAVTTDQRYVSSWETVVNRVEEMLYTWNRTRDVVYIGLLAQIKSKKAQRNNGATGVVGNAKQGASRATGRDKLYPGSTVGLDYINSIGEFDPAATGEEEEPARKKPANDTLTVSRSDLQSIIAAVMATKEDDMLGQARTQDRNNRRKDSERQTSGRHRADGRHRQKSSVLIGSLTWSEAKRIADEWLAKLGRDAPPGLNLCIRCHQWNFLHIAHGCPYAIHERTPTAMPVNNYPASKEAQTALRVEDEEALESFKAKHGGKTPREVRTGRQQQGRGYGNGGGRGHGHYGPRYQGKHKDFRKGDH